MTRINSITSRAGARIRLAVILATATTTLATRAVAQDEAVEDTAWARLDSRALSALAPTFVLRPTHFAPVGKGIGGGFIQAGSKMMGRAISFETLMSLAHDMDASRILPPVDKPDGCFDLLMTTSDASKEKLQKEIARSIGYAGHTETRTVDVLLLQLKQTGAPGLKPSQGRAGGKVSAGSSSSARAGARGRSRQIAIQGQPISNLIKNLQPCFEKPLLNRTGLTGNYDITLEVSTGDTVAESDAIAQALPAQLGLELQPSREPLDILVVQKTK